MNQVDTIALENQADRVTRLTLGIGALAGVEDQLLKNAFPIASAGTVADGAELIVQSNPIRVRCSQCGSESDATPNRLVCKACGDWRTELFSGDELLLVSVEFERSSNANDDAQRENHAQTQ